MGYNTLKLALLAGGLALSSSAMAGGIASGEMLANTCAGCHGTYGASNGPATPTIGGLNKDYLIEKMKMYRDGAQHSTIMGRIAKGYNDEEIEAMSAYLAAQTYVPKGQKHDAKLAATGAKLHKRACEKCHENGGTKGDEAGLLAGQWMPYMMNVMEDFRSGASEMPRKMATKVKKLSDADIEALMHYYASQGK